MTRPARPGCADMSVIVTEQIFMMHNLDYRHIPSYTGDLRSPA
jgi:hypothetical protein